MADDTIRNVLVVDVWWGMFRVYRDEDPRLVWSEIELGTIPTDEDAMKLLEEKTGFTKDHIAATEWQAPSVECGGGNTRLHYQMQVALREDCQFFTDFALRGTTNIVVDSKQDSDGVSRRFALCPKYRIPEKSDPVAYGQRLLAFLGEHGNELSLCPACSGYKGHHMLHEITFTYLLANFYSRYLLKGGEFVFSGMFGFVNPPLVKYAENGQILGVQLSSEDGVWGVNPDASRHLLERIAAGRATRQSTVKTVDRAKLRKFLTATSVPVDSWGEGAFEQLAEELEQDRCRLTATYYYDRLFGGCTSNDWRLVKPKPDRTYHVVRTTGEVRCIVEKVRDNLVVRTEVQVTPVPLHVCNDRVGTDISDLLEMLERYCTSVGIQPYHLQTSSYKRNPELLLEEPDMRKNLPQTYPGIVDMVDSFTMRAYTEQYLSDPSYWSERFAAARNKNR